MNQSPYSSSASQQPSQVNYPSGSQYYPPSSNPQSPVSPYTPNSVQANQWSGGVSSTANSAAISSRSNSESTAQRPQYEVPHRRATTTGGTIAMSGAASSMTRSQSIMHQQTHSASYGPGVTTASQAPSPTQSKRNSGQNYIQYGRHTNDWLFGGLSITSTIKDMLNNHHPPKN